jgi:hypothetical protein
VICEVEGSYFAVLVVVVRLGLPGMYFVIFG